MNQIITQSPIKIRVAEAGDLSFVDSLQKLHSKNVGWMQTKAIEGKIEKGEIILAEMLNDECRMMKEGEDPFTIHHSQFRSPVGYCMASDRYFKRDDVGIIYQMNIVPGHQRGLIGASLLKAQFERSAYGCRLYCCWCAQDLGANKFWEAMGFIPLAFRAGSEKKARVHIFWQRRIRSGDESTPYWFPSQTTGGSIREDRIVLPIPPGKNWFDEMPRVMPAEEHAQPRKRLAGASEERKPKAVKTQVGSVVVAAGGGLWYKPKKAEKPEVEKVAKPKKQKRKNDPKYVAAARELRDRWMERVNDEGLALPRGKYDVARMIGGVGASVIDPPQPVRQLAA